MRLTLASSVLLLVACTSTPPISYIDTGPDVDAGVHCGTDPSAEDYVDRTTPGPEGGWCCPADRPTCGCGALGGWAEERCGCAPLAHRNICDLAPSEWIRDDEHGCEAYRVPAFPTVSCLPRPREP